MGWMHIHVYQNNQHSYHYHLFLKISSLNGLYYFKHTILREKKLIKKKLKKIKTN